MRFVSNIENGKALKNAMEIVRHLFLFILISSDAVETVAKCIFFMKWQLLLTFPFTSLFLIWKIN